MTDKEYGNTCLLCGASGLRPGTHHLINCVTELTTLLGQLAGKTEYALSCCLNGDGSWTDMPASYKRELLELAQSALARIS